jgi:alkylation response protein AidB-like acyl-CoA dehydrogenase
MMSLAADGMGLALGGLRRLAGLEVLDRYGLRDRVEGLVNAGARNGFVAANAAGRQFKRASSAVGATPARQVPREGGSGLFDLTPDDEQQMLVDTFADFAATHVRPAARAADDDQAVPEKLTRLATEIGAMVLGIPEALGGVVEERSAMTGVLALEALAHGDMGLAAGIMAPASVASALALWGDADQQARYLTPFAGDSPPVAALAIAEPRPLFDPFALQTTARRDGDGYVLEGTKAMVSTVTSAELFLVAADIPGSGPALFLVESGVEGLAVRAEPTMGIRAAASGELLLTGVRVPASALLGGEESAESAGAVYAEAIARSRIAWAALATGTAQAVLDYLIPYVKERHAFGEPIAYRQAVAFTISDIAIELEGLRLATWRAASLADQGKPFTAAAAVAKQLASTHGMQIGSDGVQMLGGHGYVKEHPVERWYRDLRAAALIDGMVLV